jgi:hypothetical protein
MAITAMQQIAKVTMRATKAGGLSCNAKAAVEKGLNWADGFMSFFVGLDVAGLFDSLLDRTGIYSMVEG